MVTRGTYLSQATVFILIHQFPIPAGVLEKSPQRSLQLFILISDHDDKIYFLKKITEK
jgi:hypothetical protein